MKHILAIALSLCPFFFNSVTIAQIPTYVPTAGLCAWYPFDGNANDASGRGNDGTVYSAQLSPDRWGIDNSSYYFPGSNQQIRCNNDTLITNGTDVSASVWFLAENRPAGWDQNIIISNLGPYLASGGFQIGGGNPPLAVVGGMFRNTVFTDQGLSTAGLLSIDSSQWYHAVYTIAYIAAEDSTLASFYLDGSLVTSDKFFSHVVYTNITPFTIGNNIDSIGLQRSFKGNIDDIGLWNRALTPAEVSDLYNATPTGIAET